MFSCHRSPLDFTCDPTRARPTMATESQGFASRFNIPATFPMGGAINPEAQLGASGLMGVRNPLDQVIDSLQLGRAGMSGLGIMDPLMASRAGLGLGAPYGLESSMFGMGSPFGFNPMLRSAYVGQGASPLTMDPLAWQSACGTAAGCHPSWASAGCHPGMISGLGGFGGLSGLADPWAARTGFRFPGQSFGGSFAGAAWNPVQSFGQFGMGSTLGAAAWNPMMTGSMTGGMWNPSATGLQSFNAPWAMCGVAGTHVRHPLESRNLAQGLTLDRLEDLRAYNYIEGALDLLRGVRPTDQVWAQVSSGFPVNPQVVAQAIQLDRVVDLRIADLIEKILNYRRRNSEAVHVTEELISGKHYEGPVANHLALQGSQMGFNLVKNELANLYALTGRA